MRHKMLEFQPDHVISIFQGTALDTSLLIDHRKDDLVTELVPLSLGDEVSSHL
jgi:hypothetical protein